MSEPGFEVAAAFVRVTPDTSDFPSALDEQLGGLALSVVLTPNTSDFASMLDDALGGLTISAVVTPDASNFAAALDEQIGGLTVTAVVTPDASDFAAAFGEQAGNLTASVSLSPEAAGAANLGDAINEQAGTIALPVVPVPEVSGFEEMLTERIGGLSVPVGVYPNVDAGDFQDRLDEQVGTPVVGVDVQASVANMAEHLADSLTGSIPVPVVPDAGMFTDKLDEELAGLTVSVGVVPSASSLDSLQSLIDEGAGDLQVTATVVLNDDGALEYLAQLSAAEDAVASSADMSGAVSSMTDLGAAEEEAASGAAGLQGQVTAAAEAVAELAGAGDSAAASGAALQGSIAVSADSVSAWRVDLVALQDQYADLYGEFSEMSGELDSLNARFGTLSGGQAGATAASAEMAGQLADVNDQFAAVGGEIGSFTPKLSSMVGAAAGADEQLGLLSSMVSELRGSLSDAGGALDGWGAGIATISDAAPPAADAASGLSGVLGELSGRLSYMLVDPFMWMYAAPVVIEAVTAAISGLSGATDGLVTSLEKQDNATGYNIAGYQAAAAALEQYSQAAQNAYNSSEVLGSRGGGQGAVLAQAGQEHEASQQMMTDADNLSAHLSTLESTYGLTQQQAEELASANKVTASTLEGSGTAAGDAMTKIEAYANANINATGPVNQMATEMSIFGDDALTASTRVTALDGAYGTLVGSFVSTQQNALQVASDFLAISANAQQAGASMTGTNAQSVVLQQSFFATAGAIEQTANAMVQQGDTTQQVTGYIGAQIDKLSALTGGSAQAQQAVQGLKTWEDNLTDSTNGVYGAVNKAADELASNFSKQLTEAGLDSQQAKTDVDNLTTSIQNNGAQSTATKNDRAQLIADLEAAGVKASTAKTDVDNFITSIGKIPKSVSLTITENATGTLTITGNAQQSRTVTTSGQVNTLGGHTAAYGGLVLGGSGHPRADDIPARLSHGEYVVQASSVGKYGTGFLDSVNAGHFADGGYAGDLAGLGAWSQGQYSGIVNSLAASLEAAMQAANPAVAQGSAPAVIINFNGTTAPGPEQMHAITTALSAAVGVS